MSQSHSVGSHKPGVYFSDVFAVSSETLSEYGAFDVACTVDLPLFIDPFLLFASPKPQYRNLHLGIIQYLLFLRDKSAQSELQQGLLRAWFCFPEVKQNMFGFCATGNNGRGLGIKFAKALNENLNGLFKDFGEENIAKEPHLEKLVLIGNNVGRDNISDFTTNLIKGFLLDYTEAFAKNHIDHKHLERFMVNKVDFDYDLGCWIPRSCTLPHFNGDHVLLTPEDILTQDDTWINKEDLRREFFDIKLSVPNEALRSQIDYYFKSILPRRPKREDERRAIESTLRKFPQLIDYYIRSKEERSDIAVRQSKIKVRGVHALLVENAKALLGLLAKNAPTTAAIDDTHSEALRKIFHLKHVIENQDGYRFFYHQEIPVRRERDIQILFKLLWEGTSSSVDAEVNNGRGPGMSLRSLKRLVVEMC